MKGYIKIRKKAIEILNSKLSQKLYYHGIHHTHDVLHVINQFIKREKIDTHTAKLLRIGTLYHDIGFSISNVEHEKLGCEIAEKYMIEYGFNKKDIETVKGLIIATRIPQTPKNYLEKIICDADLDYLGRNDFYPISNQLFKELQSFSIINDADEWNKIQIQFLENHQYHTEFSQKNRQPKKEKRIEELKQS
ncbi:MAG: HD domain-containing protein [Flavobacteriaceae bacterium]|nr:HD domain-containing protein [Flavobacteriaceae bacterium]